MDRTGKGKFKAIIIESERGWGQRIDEIRRFPTKEKRDKFIKKFNLENDLPYVPDWYMYAKEGD